MPPEVTAPTRETRCHVGLELREAPPGSKSVGTLVGYAAVYGSLSEDLGGFREQIRPGAFDRALASNADVVALVNHDEDLVLGRLEATTLRLIADEKGLRVEIDLPDTTLGRDLAVQIGRRDLSKMSFAFIAVIDEWDLSGTVAVRTLIDVDLFDVSVVTWPAYRATSVTLALRSLESARKAVPPATPPPAPPEGRSPAPAIPAIEQSLLEARLRLAESH
jgi:HK97 family phage prohead protease